MLNPDKLNGPSLVNDARWAGAQTLDIKAFLGVLKRSYKMIAIVTALFIGLAVAFVMTSKPLFTAQANIVIDPRKALELSGGSATTMIQVGMDSTNIDSQVEIIRSSELAASVLKKLGLQNDPEFTTANNAVEEGVHWVRRMLSAGDSGAPPEPGVVDPDVLQTFGDRLAVERVKETFVINVRFRSRDPKRAAAITNAVTSEYIEAQLQSKRDVAGQAGGWLETQLAKQREEAVAAERKVQEFRASNDIVGAGADSVVNDQMVRETAGQLVGSETTAAQLQSKYDALVAASTSSKPDAAIVDFLDDPEVLALRTKYSQTVLQAAQAESIYGAGNVKIAEAMKKSLREQMSDALGRLLLTYGKRLSVAKSNEDSLRGKMADLVDKMKRREAAQVDLNILQRNSDTAAAIYQSVLERSKSVVQQSSFPVSEARVIDAATVPQRKSSPQMAISLALGALAGLACGVGAALAREATRHGIRLARDLDDLQMTALGFLPSIPKTLPKRWNARNKDAAERRLSKELGIYRYAVDQPFSLYAETLRTIRAEVNGSASKRSTKTIGVVSSLSGEGKSVCASNLAHIMAKGDKRVLLIDCDLRGLGLTTGLVDGPAPGLLQILKGECDFASATLVDPVTGLSFLPAGAEKRISETSDLFSSREMGDLIEQVSAMFDYVIVDLTPLTPLVDVRSINPLIDAYVLVIKWDETSRQTIADGLRNNPEVGDKLLGAVLSQVDMAKLRRYLPNGDGYLSKRSLSNYFG